VHGKAYGHREFIPLAVLKGHLEKLDLRKCLAGLPDYMAGVESGDLCT
jgi:hypothetical protein